MIWTSLRVDILNSARLVLGIIDVVGDGHMPKRRTTYTAVTEN